MEIEKVILIGFNRSALLIENYNHIRSFFDGPIQLFIDGPRKTSINDEKEQQIIKDFFSSVEDPNLICHYSELNRGCRQGVIHAISNGFKDSENAIIIEDDCFVSKTFFEVFQYFLNKKKKDLVVSSKCLFYSERELEYYLNDSIEVWGWGCTSDVWKKFQRSKDEDLLNFWLKDYKGNFILKWNNIQDLLSSRRIDTWDFPFKSFLFKEGIKTISFNKNLVNNKGFDSGTHRTSQNEIFWHQQSLSEETLKLNQKYIKNFEKIHIYNFRKCIKSVLGRLLYSLGYLRIGYRIISIKKI